MVGAGHLLFATDHPFVPLRADAARDFVAGDGWPAREGDALASGNWQRLARARG